MTDEQANAFPGSDAPAGSIIPPTAAKMENATYEPAGSRIEKMINGLIQHRDRFKDLRGVVVAVVWSRHQTRTSGGEAMLAWPELIGRLEQHFAKEVEAKLPELAIVLSYKTADAMRSEGQYIRPDTLERHLARALMSVEVSQGGIIKTVGPDVQTFAELVGWYGVHNEGEVAMRSQLELFDEREATNQQAAGRRNRTSAEKVSTPIPDPDAAQGIESEVSGSSSSDVETVENPVSS